MSNKNNDGMIPVVYLVVEGASSPLPNIPTHMWGDSQTIKNLWRLRAFTSLYMINAAGYMLR